MDIVQSTCCLAEQGLLGGMVGWPLANAIASQLKNVSTFAVQGVPYTASLYTFFIQQGSNRGARRMAELIVETVQKCSDARIVLAGYR